MIARLARSQPVVLFAFDLLYLDGYDLRGVPDLERKRLLKEVLEPSDPVRYSEQFIGHGPALFGAVRQQGLEGIVGKRAQSRYESRRSSEWVKYKNFQSAVRDVRDHRRRAGPVRGTGLGIYDGGKLRWAGNVGTGFDRKMIQAIHGKLVPLEIEKCPLEPEQGLPGAGEVQKIKKTGMGAAFGRGMPRSVTWVKPEIVCEVRFSNWTEDRKLRAPSFMGLRPDIDPVDVVREGGESAVRQTLLNPELKEEILTIDGHRLKLGNLDKVYYPQEGYKKRDLLNYYDAVVPLNYAAPQRPAAFIEALPEWDHEGGILLSKGRCGELSELAANGRCGRQRARHRQRSGDTFVSGEPGVHRP